MRNYKHLVIRLKKRKFSNYSVFDIIVILNDKKSTSSKIVEKLGFLHVDIFKRFLCFNSFRMGYYLNRGVIINKKVKSVLGLFCVKKKVNDK